MNLFKSYTIFLSTLLILFFSSSQVFGVEVPITKSPALTPATQPAPVATINIQNARIISQKDNMFNIAFGLTNREGLQTGVEYGIQLIPEGANYVADEKVYDESITLYENSDIKRQVTYVAPTAFNGSYTLVLSSRNESNFPFGAVSLGKVKLSSSKKGVEIMNDSCYLQVEGEKGSPHYTLLQGVDINTSESLKLTCNAVNNASSAMTMIPFFETRYSSGYGKLAPQIGGDYKPIVFTKGEKKTFSIVLPKVNTPQFYSLKLALMNTDSSSNTIIVHYIIRGVNGTIQKLSLDKDYYKIGDKGEMSVIWSASTGNFARSGIKGGSLPDVSFSAGITTDDGRVCGSIDQKLKRDFRNPQTKIPFEVKATCVNPKVSATLKDEIGNVLDQKEFAFKSNPVNTSTPKPLNTKSIMIVVILLLVIAGLAFFMKKKKDSNATMQ